MNNLRRWSMLGAGVCAALILLTGCKDSAGGSGAVPAANGGTGQVGQSNQGGQSTGDSGSSSHGFSCGPSSLASCLMPVPDNATESTDDAIPNGKATGAQYVQEYFGGQSASEQTDVTNELMDDQLASIAHTRWHDTEHDVEASVDLLGFADASGATEWVKTDTASYSDSTSKKLSLPGANGYDAYTYQSEGTYISIAVGRFGSVALELSLYTDGEPSAVQTNLLASWAAEQSAILRRSS